MFHLLCTKIIIFLLFESRAKFWADYELTSQNQKIHCTSVHPIVHLCSDLTHQSLLGSFICINLLIDHFEQKHNISVHIMILHDTSMEFMFLLVLPILCHTKSQINNNVQIYPLWPFWGIPRYQPFVKPSHKPKGKQYHHDTLGPKSKKFLQSFLNI